MYRFCIDPLVPAEVVPLLRSDLEADARAERRLSAGKPILKDSIGIVLPWSPGRGVPPRRSSEPMVSIQGADV